MSELLAHVKPKYRKRLCHCLAVQWGQLSCMTRVLDRRILSGFSHSSTNVIGCETYEIRGYRSERHSGLLGSYLSIEVEHVTLHPVAPRYTTSSPAAYTWDDSDISVSFFHFP